MTQQKFHYKLFHTCPKLELEEILDNLDCVREFNRTVTINSENTETKQSRASIKINQKYSFEQLDEKLQNQFHDIWFDF